MKKFIILFLMLTMSCELFYVDVSGFLKESLKKEHEEVEEPKDESTVPDEDSDTKFPEGIIKEENGVAYIEDKNGKIILLSLEDGAIITDEMIYSGILLLEGLELEGKTIIIKGNGTNPKVAEFVTLLEEKNAKVVYDNSLS